MKLRCTACRQRYSISDTAARPPTACVKCGAPLEVLADAPAPAVQTAPVVGPPAIPAAPGDFAEAGLASANALPSVALAPPPLPQFFPPSPPPLPQPQFQPLPFPPLPFGQPPLPPQTQFHPEQFPQPQFAPLPPPQPVAVSTQPGPPPLPANFGAAPPPLPPAMGATPPKDGRALPPTLAELQPYGIWKNWSSGETRLPHYLVRSQGRQLDAIVQQFVNALFRENLKGVKLAWASELTNVPGSNRPLRVVNEISSGHLGVTDAIFRSEGTDLYVKFQSTARTHITWLRLAMKSVTFLILVPLLLGAYLFGSGAHDSWIKDYAQKNGGSYFNGGEHSLFLENMVKHGCLQIDNDQFIAALKRNGSEKTLAGLLKAADERNDQMFSKMADADMLAMGGASIYFLSRVSGMSFDNTQQTQAQKDAAFKQVHPWEHWAYLVMRNDSRAAILISMWNLREEAFFVWAQEHIGNKTIESETVLMQTPNGLKIAGTLQNRVSTIYAQKSVPLAYILGAEHDSDLGRIANKAYHASVVKIPPWTIQKLYFADPSLGTRHLGGPLAVISFGIGALLWFVPISWLRLPCKFFGWPTPDEFNGMVHARNAWVERVLSDVLLHEFGVQENDRFSITSQ